MKKKLFNLLSLAFAIGFGGITILASCAPKSNQVVSSITVEMSKSTINQGEKIKLVAKSGSEVLSGVVFESSDPSIVSIENDEATGLKEGTVEIKAKKAGYKAGTASLTVVIPEVKFDTALEFEKGDIESPSGSWNSGGTEVESPIEKNESASGGSSVGYQSQGCVSTLEFTSDKAQKVKLGLVMASTLGDYSAYPNVKIKEMNLATTISLTLNGQNVDLSGKKLNGSDTANYFNWSTVWTDEVDVIQGKNSIVVTIISSQGPNMDAIYIDGNGGKFEQVLPKQITYTSLGTYDYFINGYEWGPGVDKAILHLGQGNNVSKSSLTADLFKVKTRYSSWTFDMSTWQQKLTTSVSSQEIESIYLVDENGNKNDSLDQGTNIGIDFKMKVSSSNNNGYISNSYNGLNPFLTDSKTYMNNWNPDYSFEFTLAKGKSLEIGGVSYGGENDESSVEVKEFGKKNITALKDWSESKTNSANGKTLSYKAFEGPSLKTDNNKNPLIVWLHGQGEGGTDPDIAVLGNDVTNLGEEKIQSYFKKQGKEQGAYVLAVQTPTMWMDDGTGKNNGGTAKSIYTEVLKSTIDKYIADNGDIDTSRIYLGGCSNGGYMTMNMAMEYTDFFAAYFPICEAYKDSSITDQQIDSLKNLPIWFTASKNDNTVKIDDFTSATYKRLKNKGASNVHYSLFNKVVGNDTGKEVEYDGHWSWIYALSDKVNKDQADASNIQAPSSADVMLNGKAVGLWEWLSSFTNTK